MRKGWKRVHRLVVLPDYQGIGIGIKFINEISKHYIESGFNMNLTTTTPALINGLRRDRNWVLIRMSKLKGGLDKFFRNNPNKGSSKYTDAESKNRITYSFNFKTK